MASKGGVGIDIDVARVPLREADMEPFEIMVSESQERMLCVVEPDAARRRARASASAGRSRGHGDRRGHRSGARCACSTAPRSWATCRCAALVDECPLYDLAPAAPAAPLYPPPAAHAHGERSRATRCSRCSRSPNLASRRPLFEQYDSIVQSRTVRRPEQADAAVLALARRRRDRRLDRRQRPSGRLRPLRAARSRPCSSARPTWRASAPSRSASPTA